MRRLERRMAREKAEQEALLLETPVERQAEKIQDLTAQIVAIEDELELPKMADTITGYENTLNSITTEVAYANNTYIWLVC